MYQSFIGLEVHIQLLTQSKVFCSCRAAFGGEPNTNVCPVCLGYPGVLPTLNGEAMALSYRVAMAIDCGITEKTIFERKNYFYPDLPKNYQISQFGAPLGVLGGMDLEFHKQKKRIRIKECHLEEDAGKMIHAGDLSLLDYNRSGTPLLEVVTEPDFEIGEEAEAFLMNFRRLVRHLGVCDGNMEEGSMRCDANVSVNLKGAGLGRKVEIKNLNSFKFVRKAISFEIARQTEILERGGTVKIETRLWNENRDVTEGMRSKEAANDYRYFPDPDLPPFRPSAALLDKVRASLPELPAARRARFVSEYGLAEAQSDFIIEEKPAADWFEESVRLGADPREAALWLAGDVQKILNRLSIPLAGSPLTPARFASLLSLLAKNRIHGKIAKQVLEAVFEDGKDPEAIVLERGWATITDEAELGRLVDDALAASPALAAQIRGGDMRPFGYLVGEIMKTSAGRAEPKLLQDALRKKLARGAVSRPESTEKVPKAAKDSGAAPASATPALERSIIAVVAAGGAITARRGADGSIEASDVSVVRGLFHDAPELAGRIAATEIVASRVLSEEMTPADWAALVAAVAEKTNDATVAGIVVTHGTDTLAYSASLLYWLFGGAGIPIVVTASNLPLGEKDSDAAANLQDAVRLVLKAKPGVYVSLGGAVLSPLNLKYVKAAPAAFANWNLDAPTHRHSGAVFPAGQDPEALRRRIEAIVDKTCLLKVYPGLRESMLTFLMDAGYEYFILELYDVGTANLGASRYSLRGVLSRGRDKGVAFFCTSQQEGVVDFSRYATAHELWKEGALPMGRLTTESAYTRLVAGALLCADKTELNRFMEDEHENARR